MAAKLRFDGSMVTLVEETPLPGIACIDQQVSWGEEAFIRVTVHGDPDKALQSVKVLAQKMKMRAEVVDLVVYP